MDDITEIDLRKVIIDLLAGWKWIVGITLLVGIAVFVFSLLQMNYTATALVVITEPRYLPNFDSQLQTTDKTPPTNKALVDLAMSGEIVRKMYDAWESRDKAKTTLAEYQEKYLIASVGSDPTIVVLSVQADTPEMASSLANAWAQTTVEVANRLFYGTSATTNNDFTAQIVDVKANLLAAEQALSSFESRNRISIWKNELASLLAQQSDWLRKQRLIEDTTRDAAGFIKQVQELEEGQPVPASLQTNFMVLQLKVYNDLTTATRISESMLVSSESVTPLQVQLPDSNQLQPLSKTDFVKQAQEWIEDLKSQSEEIQNSVGQLSSQVTSLQQQIQDQTSERERLELEYENSQKIYSTFMKKNEELKVTSGELYASAQVASSALTPEEPDSRNTIRNTAIALAMGFILSAGFVFIKNWWQSQRQA